MRISEQEREAIIAAVRSFDAGAHIFLFGSRTDDGKKGGDIDLLILSDVIGAEHRRKIRRKICDAIGEQKIDILVAADTRDPMIGLARSSAVPLV